jgi:hypothetical protein
VGLPKHLSEFRDSFTCFLQLIRCLGQGGQGLTQLSGAECSWIPNPLLEHLDLGNQVIVIIGDGLSQRVRRDASMLRKDLPIVALQSLGKVIRPCRMREMGRSIVVVQGALNALNASILVY